MGFCGYCGKELQYGENCDCQSAGPIKKVNEANLQQVPIPTTEFTPGVNVQAHPPARHKNRIPIIIIGSIVGVILIGVFIVSGIVRHNRNEHYLGCAETLVSDTIEEDGGAILSTGYSNEKVREVDGYGRVLITLTAHPLSGDFTNYIIILQEVYDNGEFYYYSSSALTEYPDGSSRSDLKRYITDCKSENDWDEPLS